MSDQALEEGVQLSIGEVLALLQEEFPDVTISKIRFLESQGLIQPDRTASGYRRFSGPDIERLRWILRQQRDHFLPLKVIRRMLEEGVDAYDPGGGDQPTLWTPSDGYGGDDLGPEPPADLTEDAAEVTGTRAAATAGFDPADGPSRHSPRHPAVVSSPRRFETPADVVAALQEDPRPTAPPERPGRPSDGPEPVTVPAARPPEPLPEGELGAEELCRSTGLGPLYLEGLVRFGLVRPVVRGGEDHFGPDAVVVARLAARYAELGVEPRHLRMYLVAAEREAGFVEQLAVPLLKQRHPTAREHAAALAAELSALGAELHGALLRRELGPEMGGTTAT